MIDQAMLHGAFKGRQDINLTPLSRIDRGCPSGPNCDTGKRKTLLTRQIAFELLPASVLFTLL